VLEGESLNERPEDVYVVGKIMFVNDVVKVNFGGRTRVIDEFKTEEERVSGLKKWFGISRLD
jgi:hypothetical protein